MTSGDHPPQGVLPAGATVQHGRHGPGRVELDRGDTAIVRFAHGLEECPTSSLQRILSLRERIASGTWDSPLAVVARLQAEAIRSVNDAWGVFSRSRIDLLPHQLWVCRKVLERWPPRWLVADDVGLGKTIEAGLILWPLLSSGRVRRLLVVCPASLCEQWQIRLREMFDIRMALHDPAVDTAKSDFWNTHHQVIASLQTLRLDTPGAASERQSRLIDSQPWDLVVVDEAHHLNHDEQSGPTLGYKLFDRLVSQNRIRSMVFFTGTPHRGKHFGFLALLRLLRPDHFDPAQPLASQLPALREVLIRNNKSSVTDLKGRRLFTNPVVTAESYQYSDPERSFYHMLSEFIATGRAYANSLSAGDARTVQLVLIAMQKLASSSVAAIRRALEGRLSRIRSQRREVDALRRRRDALAAYADAEGEGQLDELARLEEEIVELEADVSLAADEAPALQSLLDAAAAVTSETKIRRILEIVAERFPDEPVLFFTEYKATQAELMSALIAKYGDGCVTFINGDGRIEDVLDSRRRSVTLRHARQDACDQFCSGKVRFLVSTEAAGEGVDLQERCSALIHVDLPWNPMRLHQRVGRLNRYGQQHRVRVVSVRNPETVEARIWDKLDSKIKNIMQAQAGFMDEPEDLLELVLGMTSPAVFRELFAGADQVPRERLSEWFDQKTARFGGLDAVETVRALVGNAAKFDFHEVASQIPPLDLPDLRLFFLNMLALNRRRVSSANDAVSFKAPEEWLADPAVRNSYEGLVFDRRGGGERRAESVIGVGHRVFNAALNQAVTLDGQISALPSRVLDAPLVVFRVVDRVTDMGGHVRAALLAVQETTLLRDWEVVSLLNAACRGGRPKLVLTEHPAILPDAISAVVDTAVGVAERCVAQLDLPFQVPVIEPLAVLMPYAGTKMDDPQPEGTNE